jgi:hypothetical protein
MALGWIDPARLDGDALRRWYMRSPADLEEERRGNIAAVYDTFSLGRDAAPPHHAEVQQRQERSRDRQWVSEQLLRDVQGRRERIGSQSSSDHYRLAAASPRGSWEYWKPRSCQTCHGYTPETLPPIGGRSPTPPGYSPRTGGSGGSGGSGSTARPRGDWSDRPQCNQQFEADRKICQTAKNPECWQNQNKRLGHCSRTGEVGTPGLGFGRPGR